MKLVKENDRQNTKFIVSEHLIKRGFDFESSNSFFVHGNEYLWENFLEERHKKGDYTFWDYVKEYKIYHKYVPNKYITTEEMKTLIPEFKYFWDDEIDELISAEDVLDYDKCNFLEYYNGNDLEQIEIQDEIISLSLIKSNLKFKNFSKNKIGQYNLYKDNDDKMYLYWNSYFTNDLGKVEEVTEAVLNAQTA